MNFMCSKAKLLISNVEDCLSMGPALFGIVEIYVQIGVLFPWDSNTSAFK